MDCCNVNRLLKDLNITVVVGTSATIIVQTFQPVDYGFYTLLIGQFIPPNVGTEPVTITDAAGTFTLPLIDNAGNIVPIGKLRGGRVIDCGCTLKPSRYRLQFGSNGLPTAIPHFVVKDGLCPLVYNGSAGSLAAQPTDTTP